MKITSPGEVIANIYTSTTVESISMLFLSWVTNAWNWGCLGTTQYTVSFENRMADDVPGYDMRKNEMTILCQCRTELLRDIIVKPNPEASFTFCGGWFRIPYCLCDISLSNSNWNHDLEAFGNNFNCERTERHCRWQIRKEHPFLYDSYKNEYVQKYYVWEPK